jgi:hypothetical protein
MEAADFLIKEARKPQQLILPNKIAQSDATDKGEDSSVQESKNGRDRSSATEPGSSK